MCFHAITQSKKKKHNSLKTEKEKEKKGREGVSDFSDSLECVDSSFFLSFILSLSFSRFTRVLLLTDDRHTSTERR